MVCRSFEYWLLLAIYFATRLVCGKLASGSTPILLIVTHHKSGTVAARLLYEYITEKNNSYVFLLEDGLKSMWEDQLRLRHGKPFAIHVIRHPLDMLISGYNYHKACSEMAWTNCSVDKYGGTRRGNSRFPDFFPLKYNYCMKLQNMSLSSGLQAEMIRSLYAHDGIGFMFHNMNAFKRHLPVEHILNICLEDLHNDNSTTIDKLTQFLRPWNTFQKRVHIIDQIDHHSKADANINAQLFYDMAWDIVKQNIHVNFLKTFPCSSRYKETLDLSW